MFWWEQASWPAAKGKERGYRFFEDIRRLIFLLENPAAGNFDVNRIYGKSLDGDITYVPYDENNWAGSWDGYAPPNLAKEGWVKVVYKDHTGAEDIYVNYKKMSEADLDEHPPIKSDGKLDTRYWRLGVNPNYYCHYNQNAGKPEINADGRHFVIYHAGSETYGFLPYVCDLQAHKWLPRHTHPYRQVAPVKYKSGEVKQRRDPALYGVETKNKYISQNLGAQWPRDYEAKYRKITEYVMELGEPDAGIANQYGHDPKMCEAYQDRAIRTMEHETRYLGEVDQEYAAAWTKRQGTEWTGGGTSYKDGTTQWTVAASIVYPPGGAADGTRYLCIKSHLSDVGNQPPDPEFWTTPAYRPDLCIHQPVYERLGERFFCCNGSAFEKTLKNIGHYDWWWDPAFPYVPKALKDLRDDDGPADWPLPCGCWRRTWRHSMGRVSAIMWPGESEPPEYYPDHWSVTQQVYDTIPGANQHEYKVVNNPPDFVLTEEQEAALAKRHDPKASSSTKVDDITIIGPHYEIHHDLVNDIWNALKELHLVDWSYDSKCWFEVAGQFDVGDNRETSLAAYALGRFGFEDNKTWYYTDQPGSGWGKGMEEDFGYRMSVHATSPTEYGPFWEFLPLFSFRLAVNLRVPKTAMLPGLQPGLLSGRLLLRIAWKGMDCTVNPDITCYADCEFGFEDKTITGKCGHTTYKCEWIALEPRGPIVSDATYNYYMFYGYTLSPWPYTKNGECMDWEWVGPDMDVKFLQSYVTMKVPGWTVGITRRSVFDIDWNKIPVSVFEELEMNFIKVKG